MIARELDGHGSPTAETKSVTLDRQAALLRSKIGGLRGISTRSRSAQLLRHSSPFRSRHPESTLSRDLVDLDADRKHPTKKNRPLDAGTLTTSFALAAAAILIASAVLIALFVTIEFAELLGLPRDRLFFHSETEDADRRHRTVRCTSSASSEAQPRCGARVGVACLFIFQALGMLDDLHGDPSDHGPGALSR
jgi:hypothetical protein